MKSHFKITNKVRLSDLPLGSILNESDFSTLTSEGDFIQMEYVEQEDIKDIFKVKPGIFTIKKSMTGLVLEATQFVTDELLDSFVQTAHIEHKVECFFNKFDVYKKLKFEVPKRAFIIYGIPGSGKTSVLTKICNKYVKDSKTCVVIWPTDRFEAYDVKEFLKSFEYEGVEKLIFVVEDIGGVEQDQVRQGSNSSLLSLLDNKEKTFKVPTLIMATTNHPEVLHGNLTNRPDRFDDKIEVGFPPKEAREALLNFFAKDMINVEQESINLILSKDCDKMTPAHIKDVIVSSLIYDIPIVDSIKRVIKDIKDYEKAFQKHNPSGFGLS